MSVPANCKYTKEHEWLKDEGKGVYRVGITDYAQKELGDVVFVDLPEVGRSLKKGESFSAVESVKAVSDVYSPVNSVVLEVNTELADNPQLLNQDPYQQGWMISIQTEDSSQYNSLLDAAAYTSYLAEISK